MPNRHATYEALVADPDVDVVYVATPHPMHHDAALLAIEAGKAVLVEKPFTMDAGEARCWSRPPGRAGVFLMEAMWTRFLPHIDAVRELLADGRARRRRDGHRRPRPVVRRGPRASGSSRPSWAAARCSTSASTRCRSPRWCSAPRSGSTALSDPAFTGVDAQTSMLLGYAGGAHAVLNSTLRRGRPTRRGDRRHRGADRDRRRLLPPIVVHADPARRRAATRSTARRGHGLRHRPTRSRAACVAG